MLEAANKEDHCVLLQDMDKICTHELLPMGSHSDGTILPNKNFVKGVMSEMPITSAEDIKLRNIEVKLESFVLYVDVLVDYDWSDQAEEGALLASCFSSSIRKKLEKIQKEKDSIQFNVDKFENASNSLNKLIECQIVDNYKKGLGYEKYNAVPPPYTGNFMPPTPDLSFTGLDEFVNKPAVEKKKSDEEVSKVVRKSDDSSIIKDWVSNNEEENVPQTKTEKKAVKPSIAKKEFVKPKQQEKTARKIVKQIEKHRQNTHSLRGNQRNWNNMMSQKLGRNFEMFNKACYVCGSFYHLVNHQNFAKKTHPCAKKNLVPRAVLMKSGLVSVNTARQVNNAHSKTTVNAARPLSCLSKTTHLTVKRPIHKNTAFKNSNIDQRVNTVSGKKINTARPKAVVNAVKGNNFNVVKASACWVWKPKHKVLDHGNPQMDLQDQGVIDSGCSRHMTGNMSYLTDYEEIDRGYVAFGGNPKGGKITGKANKDETSSILKSFITGIENLVDHKVKVIRCDNKTEFKNKEMNQFCRMKGILRQFSVARTPQQIKVAERRNRTPIEATRTMLVDSKLPTTFWAEAVNTACYVQNKVLVVKPHNKTPYELFHGKADEGFFIGYSLNSKAFRVFNSRTRIVEKNLHIRFNESTPNAVGSGPNWLFDIDALTRTMNYKPIVVGTHDDGKKVKEDLRKNSESNHQEKEDNVNSTNNVNAASTNKVNAVGGKTSIELPDDPNMSALEDYSKLTSQEMNETMDE
ncbi:ribonuclease H-like domain-containing protein [Tanacetum coccineum]